jgi:hypothetical protein
VSRAIRTLGLTIVADDDKPMEPWFFEIEAPFPLDDEDRERITTLNTAGRAIVQRMVEHIAIDEDIPAEAMTPDFADRAIDRARDAIHAARGARPGARPKTDLEELAFKYMDAMRLWLRIYRAAREAKGG